MFTNKIFLTNLTILLHIWYFLIKNDYLKSEIYKNKMRIVIWEVAKPKAAT